MQKVNKYIKMFSIFNHQEKTNQNNKILPHFNKNGYYQK